MNVHEISHIWLDHGQKETQTRKCLVNKIISEGWKTQSDKVGVSFAYALNS